MGTKIAPMNLMRHHAVSIAPRVGNATRESRTFIDEAGEQNFKGIVHEKRIEMFENMSFPCFA